MSDCRLRLQHQEQREKVNYVGRCVRVCPRRDLTEEGQETVYRISTLAEAREFEEATALGSARYLTINGDHAVLFGVLYSVPLGERQR